MEKLNFLGVGPKIGRVALPLLAIVITLTILFPKVFTFGENAAFYLLIAGILLLITGVVFYFLTVRALLKGLKRTMLMTTGTYGLCQNPLYASLMLMIVPGLSLVLNSWIILVVPVIAFIVFKKTIHSEYEELGKFFGEEYRKYRDETPEFFPFPLKKWSKK
jgi:protein-S-isoprenylcysteine O-methyltransferase Ste14